MLIKNKNGIDVAILVQPHDRGTDLDKLVFVSQDDNPIQVGIWNNYSKQHQFSPHIHLKPERRIQGINELFYVEKGQVNVWIYDDDEELVFKTLLDEGCILIQLSGGHNFEVTEDKTTVIEVKNGPYLGKDADKRIFQPKE